MIVVVVVVVVVRRQVSPLPCRKDHRGLNDRRRHHNEYRILTLTRVYWKRIHIEVVGRVDKGLMMDDRWSMSMVSVFVERLSIVVEERLIPKCAN